MITVEELAARCEWVMRRNEKILRAEGRTNPDYYFGRGSGSLLYHMRFDKLAPMMNNGPVKESLFSMVRYGVEINKYDCVVFCCNVWHTHDGHRSEALGVIGQTPRDIHNYAREYERDPVTPMKIARVWDGARASYPIEEFAGRMKMYGDWGEPEMPPVYEQMRTIIDRNVGAETYGKFMHACCRLVNTATEEP